ncbi:TPA: triple tyrosine motif-containing protein [Bacillus cereus]
MKSLLLRLGVLTCIIFLGLSYEKASAESTWQSQCESYGEIKPNQNPSFQHINCLLTSAALEAKIPPEVVKAVANQETGWRQFENGQPIISKDGGIGLMQLTNQLGYDQQKLKYDIKYNIQAGVEILSNMYGRNDLPKIKGAGSEVIENWYFPVMAYNGKKQANSPLKQSSGEKNVDAYQEKVFALIKNDSFINDTELGKFPFRTDDFEYLSAGNIKFRKMEYILTDPIHVSTYSFQMGDKVVVTEDNAKLRSKPSGSTGSEVVTYLPENTIMTIDGKFSYDQNLDSKNQYVWYPVKTVDQKFVGYISSAYIMKIGKVTKVNLTSDKVAPQAMGTPIQLKVTSEGSNEPQYRFYIRDEKDNLTTLQKYGSADTATWTPTNPGTYRIIIHAKDKNSSMDFESRTEVSYKIEAGKVTSVNVAPDKVAPQAVDTPIQLKVTSEGSKEPQYRFYIRDEKDNLITLQKYGSADTATWTPTNPGTYRIIIHAKDKNSSMDFDSRTEISYKVAGKVTSVNVTPDKVAPQTAGVPIQLKVTSEGSKEPQYRFYIRDEKDNLTTLQKYGSVDTATWTPTKSGTYRIIIHAKDKNSSMDFDSRTEVSYKIEAGKVTSVNITSDKAAPQAVGVPIQLKATSKGSEEPEYRFLIRDEKEALTTLQEYDKNETVKWIPTKPGTYRIIVHAKDKSKPGLNYYYESRTEMTYKVQ